MTNDNILYELSHFYVRHKRMIPIVAIGFILLMLTACSGEQIVEPTMETKPETIVLPEPEPEPEVEKGIPLFLRGYVAPFTEVAGALTRSDFIDGGIRYTEPVEYLPIGAFFTKNGSEPEERRILCNPTDNGVEWSYTPPVEIPGGGYQFYGYMPSNAAEVTIEPNTAYADGATLHFTGMNIVTTKDLCVLVGAKHGTDAEHPVEDDLGNSLLKTGNFDCQMSAGANANNYLFLLFDHIYASIGFRFRLDSDYAKARSIHLKKLQLTAYSDNTFTVRRRKEINAEISLRKTTDGSSPIQSITFTDNLASEEIDKETFFIGDIDLKSGTGEDSWTDEIAYVPYTRSYYILTSTYDVYDKMGNLIRQNCTADNKINPFSILNISDMQRGKKYVLKLTISPTYLYQLSDQDLDNPTVQISN